MSSISSVTLLLTLFAAITSAEIQVIGTGSGRTGSTSLHEALTILGYKTYHMKEVILNSNSRGSDMEFWVDAYKTNCSDTDGLKKLFDSGGYSASAHAIHFPCLDNMIFNAYPDAKIIHTERTDAELWHDSVSNSICQQSEKMKFFNILGFFLPPIRRVRKFIPYLFSRVILGSVEPVDVSLISKEYCLSRKEDMIKHYKEHNARIKKMVPKKRLLVLTNHKDGWEPICKFLGKDIPDVPFPHVNSRSKMMSEIYGQLLRKNPSVVLKVILVLGLFVGIFWKKKASDKMNNASGKKDL